jgi:hypothetical protein
MAAAVRLDDTSVTTTTAWAGGPADGHDLADVLLRRRLLLRLRGPPVSIMESGKHNSPP